MDVNLKFPLDTLIVSKNDLKSVLRELIGEINTEDAAADFLTIKDAAALLKISVPTARKLIERKEIPSFKSGQIIRLNRHDVIEWMGKN